MVIILGGNIVSSLVSKKSAVLRIIVIGFVTSAEVNCKFIFLVFDEFEVPRAVVNIH